MVDYLTDGDTAGRTGSMTGFALIDFADIIRKTAMIMITALRAVLRAKGSSPSVLPRNTATTGLTYA